MICVDSITLLNIIKKHNLKIATVESITGGAIINELTNIPGFSDTIYGGLITYNMDAKNELLSPVTIDVYSTEYSQKMCDDVFNKTSASIVLSITGHANSTDKLSYEYYTTIAIRKDNAVLYEHGYVNTNDHSIDKIDNPIKRRKMINKIIVSSVLKKVLNFLTKIYDD